MYKVIRRIFTFFLILLLLLINLSCGPSLKLIKNNFYNYDTLSSELKELQTNYPDILTVQSIGKSYEGRAIYAIGLRGKLPSKNKRPALMAIFTEHAAEHDVTSLAMGIVKYLIKNYGNEKKITNLMNEKEIYIIPMMNPDGVVYDLSGRVKPFTWRKNRRPINEKNYGVDLNRNWGYKWHIVPETLKKKYYSPNSDYYHGEKPFSENETSAIRDFLLNHKNIKLFVDYHSGSAPFLQGGIGFPFAYSEKELLTPESKKRYKEIAQNFAALVSNPNDKRKEFIVSQARDVGKNIKKYAPFYLKPFIGFFLPKSTLAAGGSADWVYGKLGIMAFGVEIFRCGNFFKRLPESKDELTKNQVSGFLLLLETLSDDPF